MRSLRLLFSRLNIPNSFKTLLQERCSILLTIFMSRSCIVSSTSMSLYILLHVLEIPRTLSAELFSMWEALSIYQCLELLCPMSRTLHFSLLIFMKFQQHISPGCQNSSGQQHNPLAYRNSIQFYIIRKLVEGTWYTTSSRSPMNTLNRIGPLVMTL